jgi:hypothetical protein
MCEFQGSIPSTTKKKKEKTKPPIQAYFLLPKTLQAYILEIENMHRIFILRLLMHKALYWLKRVFFLKAHPSLCWAHCHLEGRYHIPEEWVNYIKHLRTD